MMSKLTAIDLYPQLPSIVGLPVSIQISSMLEMTITHASCRSHGHLKSASTGTSPIIFAPIA
jgi:hypothetical protein